MESWAIVIGIDHYPEWPEGALRAAVRDALGMREWLLDPAGGAVPPAQLVLLLSLAPGSALPPGTACDGDATSDNIRSTIMKLGQRTAGADRLFFYYAGHGMSTSGFGSQEAITGSNFSPTWPDRSITTASIFGYLQTLPFADQFIFIDACRNMPGGALQPVFGQMPYQPQAIAGGPGPQQFRVHATTLGGLAAEIGPAGEERGAFTSAVLDGLRGQGAAKYWQPAGRYVVRFGRLFAHVQSSMRTRRAADTGGTAAIQIPEQDGPRGRGRDPDPILATIPAANVLPVTLRVWVSPTDAPRPARLIVRRDESVVKDEEWTGVAPVAFDLMPREYAVATVSAQLQQEPDPCEIDLYESADAHLHWTPKPGGSPPPSPPGDAAPGGPELTVSARDPLSLVQLRDGGGTVIETAHGHVFVQGIDPGFYRAVVSTPEGAQSERLVHVQRSSQDSVVVDVPPLPKTPLVGELFESTGFAFNESQGLEVSNLVGPMANARVSTVLALGGLFEQSDELRAQTHRLLTLGVSRLEPGGPGGPSSAVQLLMAAHWPNDQRGDDYVASTVVALHEADYRLVTESTALPLPRIAGLGEWHARARPGPYLLSIQLPGRSRTLFSLPLLADSLARLVVEVLPDGRAQLFQYQAPFRPDGPSGDPTVLRQLELLQRYAVAGKLEEAADLLPALARPDWIEPIAAAVLSVVLRRLGRSQDTVALADRLTVQYPEMSDGWLGLAEQARETGRLEVAAGHYGRALDAGVPIVADSALRLWAGVLRHGISRPGLRALDQVVSKRVPGALWTAWEPDRPPVPPQLAP